MKQPQLSFTASDVASAIESMEAGPHCVALRGAVTQPACDALIEAGAINDREYRRTRVMEILRNECSGLFESLVSVADAQAMTYPGRLRPTREIASTVLYRARNSEAHIDVFEFDQVHMPSVFGPVTVSFGVRGTARIRDYGPLLFERLDPNQLLNRTTVQDIGGKLGYFIDSLEFQQHEAIDQAPGDVVLIPCLPYPVVHDVVDCSHDRCAVISGQLWVDSDQFAIDNPDDMTKVRKMLSDRLRPSTSA
jgi:hypothetical protein